MLSLQFIRQNPELVREALAKRQDTRALTMSSPWMNSVAA